MATASNFRDDFLTCSICYDVYTIPKSLPCLHTFCLKCLSSYIVAEDEHFGVKRKKGFPCPLCRELVEAPCASKPLEEWASDFKTNFYIESLMNALKVKESESEQLTIVNILSNVSSMQSPITPTSMDPLSQATNSNSSRNVTIPSITSDERRRFETAMTNKSTMHTLNPQSLQTANISHLACMPYQRRFHLLKDLSGEMQDDNTKPQLCAICVVGGVVAVLDFRNQSLKTFSNWKEHDVKIQSLHLSGKPKSVTNVLDSFVAVTVPCQKSVYIISIQSELEVVSLLRTERCYKSIHDSGLGNFIAVTCQIHQRETLSGNSLGPIDIIDYEGNRLSSLRICSELIHHDFTCISVSPSGLIHLVDSTAHTLVCFTQYGHEMFRYEPESEEENFLSPNGLCCRTGDIYVTHFEANSVFVIKCDGGLPVAQEKIVSISDGVKQPMDVHVEPDGTVFVACWDGVVRIYFTGAQPSILKKHMETAV